MRARRCGGTVDDVGVRTGSTGIAIEKRVIAAVAFGRGVLFGSALPDFVAVGTGGLRGTGHGVYVRTCRVC